MCREFLEREWRMFLEGMCSGFLEVWGGGIGGWVLDWIRVERWEIWMGLVRGRG